MGKEKAENVEESSQSRNQRPDLGKVAFLLLKQGVEHLDLFVDDSESIGDIEIVRQRFEEGTIILF